MENIVFRKFWEKISTATNNQKINKVKKTEKKGGDGSRDRLVSLDRQAAYSIREPSKIRKEQQKTHLEIVPCLSPEARKKKDSQRGVEFPARCAG